MATYRLSVQETVFHTYEVEIPDSVTEDEIDNYFYNMEVEEQENALVESESYGWEIDDIQKV